jgi:hypothetical protein
VAIGDLDMLEESWIRAGGGTGGLDNARVRASPNTLTSGDHARFETDEARRRICDPDRGNCTKIRN